MLSHNHAKLKAEFETGPAMARTFVIAAIACLAHGAAAIVPGAAIAAPGASVNDTARVLAGLPPSSSSPLAGVINDASWNLHQRLFDQAWSRLEARQLTKIRGWTSKNIENPSPVVFYMFSGPDFLYADAFMPSATTYVMSGLEPAGDVPDLVNGSRGTLTASLQELRASLTSVLSYSFFRTKAMNVDLRSGRLTGTVPILLVFLARSGKTIDAVTPVHLSSDGTLHDTNNDAAATASKGVRITFTDNVGARKTVYYFSTDLSDGGVKTSGFLEFCDKFGTGFSFVKSASYLMHEDSFSKVREFLLSHSSALLQDDSGIPIRHLAEAWRLQPYGAYVGPIPIFGGNVQSPLYRLFAKSRAGDMDFSFGYQHRPRTSNLLLAIKDSTASANDVLTLAPRRTRPANTYKRPAYAYKKPPAAKRNAVSEKKPARTYRRRAARKTKIVSNGTPKLFGYSDSMMGKARSQ